MPKEVYKDDLDAMMRAGATLVDVREDEDCDTNPGLPGHTHVPLSRLSDLSAQIAGETNRPTIFYCRSGLMSFQAAEIARAWTQAPVYYLAGGLLGCGEV